MYQIKTLNKISPHGLDVFNRNKYLCGDDVDQPDGILANLGSDIFQKLQLLFWIAKTGTQGSSIF